jgi:hypothetical protein
LTGGDYRVIVNDIGAFLKGNKAVERYGIDRAVITEELNRFKVRNTWVKDFTFGSYAINKGLEKYSSSNDFSYASELVSENRDNEFAVQLVDRNYFDIVNTDKLQIVDMWQPRTELSGRYRKFSESEVVEMMY